MTELLISSKLRGKPFKWEYLLQRYLGDAGVVSGSGFAGDVFTEQHAATRERRTDIYGSYWFAQTFPAPASGELRKVELLLRKYGNPTANLVVELWNTDGTKPTTRIGEIGQIPPSSVTTIWTWIAVEKSPGLSVTSGTKYAIVCYQAGNAGNSSNTYRWGGTYTSDQYPNGEEYQSTDGGATWTLINSNYDLLFKAHVYVASEQLVASKSVSFPESSGAASKRLDIVESTWSGVTKVLVNGQNVGNRLDLSDPIPQSDNYTIDIYASGDYSISGTIKKYLYYNKQPISPDDFGFSEAYLLKVEYLENGSSLRIDDNLDMELNGDAGIVDEFTNILIPWRKLKWITGRGRVLALGIE